MLVRPGHIDVGGVGAHVGRCLGHQRLRLGWKADELLLEHESAQSLKLRPRAGHRPAGGLVGVHLCDTGGGGAVGQVLRAGLPQGGEIAFEVGIADLEQPLDRQVDALGDPEHLQEHGLAQGEGLGRVCALGLEPALESIHCLGGGGVRGRQLGLCGRVLDAGKHGGDVVAIEAGEAPEPGDAVLDEALRQRRLEVRTDLRADLRYGAHVADVALQALLERCIVARQVHVRIQPFDVPGRIGEGIARALPPEELAVDHRIQMLALEALGSGELRVAEGGRLGAQSLQQRHLGGDALRAPIRHLPVKLVAPRLDRKLRFGPEVRLEEARCELRPGVGRGLGLAGGRGDARRPAAGCEPQHQREREASGPQLRSDHR